MFGVRTSMAVPTLEVEHPQVLWTEPGRCPRKPQAAVRGQAQEAEKQSAACPRSPVPASSCPLSGGQRTIGQLPEGPTGGLLDMELAKRPAHSLAAQKRPKSWPMYFQKENYSPLGECERATGELIEFLQSPRGKKLLQVRRNQECLTWHLSCSNISSTAGFPDLILQLLESRPDDALRCLALAAAEILHLADREDELMSVNKVAVRLRDYKQSRVAMRDIRASSLGNLVTVRGTVVRVTGIKPLVVAMDFTCQQCSAVTTQDFPDGRFSLPEPCPSGSCRSRTFIQHRDSAKKVSFQRIRLQEDRAELSGAEEDEGEAGGRGVPRTVECELREDLVDSCCPGDTVVVCGFVRVMNQDISSAGASGRGRRRDQCLFQLHIAAVSVVNVSRTLSSCSASCSTPPELRMFSHRDLRAMHSFVTENQGSLLHHLVHSLCPSICGHELLKAGILLSLFGGVRKHAEDPCTVPVRGDIHVLIVGDPGQGKSQLLRAASVAAPRSVYVCGGGASTAGLTVSVVKDQLTGDFAFDAGALVLADFGACFVDEFDKCGNEHEALLEAMEQQTVSVAKAGLMACLPARTSIIAAANPAGGLYNPTKTLVENLRISQPLLSRFDLIFLVQDQRDTSLDAHLSSHVMAIHTRRSEGGLTSSQASGFSFRSGASQRSLSSVHALGLDGPRDSLLSRLRGPPSGDGVCEAFPARLLQKYIAYARTYVFPKMTREAASVLKKFYVDMRERAEQLEGVPVTVRLLESVIRLAEARARLELRETITADDAKDVVQLMKACVFGRACADDPMLDGHAAGNGKRSSSKSKEKQRFLRHIQMLAKQDSSPPRLFARQEFGAIADSIGLRVPDVDALVNELNEAGMLLIKGGGKYEVVL